jgi:alpha-L-arabinofuranosidase
MEAAAKGDITALQKLREDGHPWNTYVCMAAAEQGHLEVLQYLRANNCPWDEWTTWVAAKNRHVEVFKWAIANRCPWSEPAFREAKQGGFLTVLTGLPEGEEF